MSTQLISLVPHGPLTDTVFVFNQEHFLQILDYQKRDLGFLALQPIRALAAGVGVVGDTATAITAGVGNVAQGVSKGLFGVARGFTGPIGGALLGQAEHLTSGVIGTTEHVAEHLVDPSKVVREHMKYSNDIHDNLTPAIVAVDNSIRLFSYALGEKIHEIHENVPANGPAIIAALEVRLDDVITGLANLISVLTRNNVQENIKIGKEKYHGIILSGGPITLFLEPMGDLLPRVVASIAGVKTAFEAIKTNFDLVKVKIKSGITDPKLIFVETHEVVSDGWRHFEVQRKTMTYLQYHN